MTPGSALDQWPFLALRHPHSGATSVSSPAKCSPPLQLPNSCSRLTFSIQAVQPDYLMAQRSPSSKLARTMLCHYGWIVLFQRRTGYNLHVIKEAYHMVWVHAKCSKKKHVTWSVNGDTGTYLIRLASTCFKGSAWSIQNSPTGTCKF